MKKNVAVSVENVGMRFNLNQERVDNLKEYVIKFLKRDLKYSEFWALKDINFEIKKGQRLGVLGLNGSGKSTLLNVLGALLIPDDGEIWLNGKKEEQYSEEPHATEIRNRHIGFIFQDFSLLNDLSVRENVSLPLILKGEKEKRRREL